MQGNRADKATEQRIKEIDLRILQLRVEEEVCLQTLAGCRSEVAKLNLERHNLLNPLPKK